MWGDDGVREVPQRGVGWEGFGLEDVERGAADHSLLERLHERVLLDYRPARDVHEDALVAQDTELLATDQSARLVGERARDDDVVRPGEHLVEAVRRVDLVDGIRSRRGIALRPDDGRPERRRQFGDTAPDGAEPDDTDRLPPQFAALVAQPQSRHLLAHATEDLALEQEEIPQNLLGDRLGVDPGGVRQQDPRLAQRLLVVEVHAGAECLHPPELLGSPEHRRREPGRQRHLGVRDHLQRVAGRPGHAEVQVRMAVRDRRRERVGVDPVAVRGGVEQERGGSSRHGGWTPEEAINLGVPPVSPRRGLRIGSGHFLADPRAQSPATFGGIVGRGTRSRYPGFDGPDGFSDA